MKKAVIFGASGTGKMLYPKLKEKYEILYATDNDAIYYGGLLCGEIPIKDKTELCIAESFDYIIIASVSGLDEIYYQLVNEFKIEESKIIRSYSELFVSAKFQFVESFARIAYAQDIKGNVAEVGVFRGEFAKEINRVFPDRMLYLFDTFEGFDQRDVDSEQKFGHSNAEAGQFSITNPDSVLSKLPQKDKAVIKKGYFPETFDLNNEHFCFVNLDTDLYQPILAGLKIFYPLMSKGGVILIHDYFSILHQGVKAAVDEFINAENIPIIPIGDYLSVAVLKR